MPPPDVSASTSPTTSVMPMPPPEVSRVGRCRRCAGDRDPAARGVDPRRGSRSEHGSRTGPLLPEFENQSNLCCLTAVIETTPGLSSQRKVRSSSRSLRRDVIDDVHVRLGGADDGHLAHVGIEAELAAGRELQGLLDAQSPPGPGRARARAGKASASRARGHGAWDSSLSPVTAPPGSDRMSLLLHTHRRREVPELRRGLGRAGCKALPWASATAR